MSYNKETKSKRRYMDDVHILKQQKIYKDYNNKNFETAGKFRKKKAMSCGNSKCFFCTNPRRLWGFITLKEIVAIKDFKYQLSQIV